MRLLILSAVILAGCLTPTAVREAESAKALGYAYLGEGNSPGAIGQFRKATVSNQWDRDAWQGLGLAYFSSERHDDAEAALIKAIELSDGDFPQGKLNLGSLYLEVGRYEEAVPLLQAAAEHPEYRQPHKARHNLAWAQYNLGRYSDARKSLGLVLRQFPLFCPAIRNLAAVDEAEGRNRDALTRYLQAEHCDPSDLNTRLALGTMQARLDLVTDACSNLETVAKADPYGELRTQADDIMSRLDCASVGFR
jgi:tetratricopeptide (TPR) repeat protein